MPFVKLNKKDKKIAEIDQHSVDLLFYCMYCIVSYTLIVVVTVVFV